MNTLRAGQLLKAGEKLESPNGRVVLLMRDDGNLVLYRGMMTTIKRRRNPWPSTTTLPSATPTLQVRE